MSEYQWSFLVIAVLVVAVLWAAAYLPEHLTALVRAVTRAWRRRA